MSTVLTEEARKKLESELNPLIESYQKNKILEKQTKETVDGLNKQIKKLFLDNSLEEHFTDKFKAKLTITPKSEFNEEMAIEILRKNLSVDDFKAIVKTKEYIDEDALENYIYMRKIDESLLAGCIKELNPIYTLRITELKK